MTEGRSWSLPNKLISVSERIIFNRQPLWLKHQGRPAGRPYSESRLNEQYESFRSILILGALDASFLEAEPPVKHSGENPRNEGPLLDMLVDYFIF